LNFQIKIFIFKDVFGLDDEFEEKKRWKDLGLRKKW